MLVRWIYWLAASSLKSVPKFIVVVFLFLLRVFHTGLGKSYGEASMEIKKETKISLDIQSPFKLMIWCFPFIKTKSQPSDIFKCYAKQGFLKPMFTLVSCCHET